MCCQQVVSYSYKIKIIKSLHKSFENKESVYFNDELSKHQNRNRTNEVLFTY